MSIDFKKHLPKNVEITLKNILIFTQVCLLLLLEMFILLQLFYRNIIELIINIILQNILAYPITENTVNIDACNLSKNDSSSYKKAAEHCAKDTQIIFGL